jgi:hypothetical protein
LAKGHANKLIPTGESPDAPIPAIAGDDTAKGVVGNEGEELGENSLTVRHPLRLRHFKIEIVSTSFTSQNIDLNRTVVPERVDTG